LKKCQKTEGGRSGLAT